MPVELLAILQREIDERLKRDKAAKTRFDAGLAVRYATRATEERRAAGKDTGTVRFDDGEVRSHVVVVPSRTPHHVVRTDGRVLVVLVEPSAFQSKPTLPAAGGALGQDLVRLAELTGSGPRSVDAGTILRRGISLVEGAGGTPAPHGTR